jgi:hypothetical protein
MSRPGPASASRSSFQRWSGQQLRSRLSKLKAGGKSYSWNKYSMELLRIPDIAPSGGVLSDSDYT